MPDALGSGTIPSPSVVDFEHSQAIGYNLFAPPSSRCAAVGDCDAMWDISSSIMLLAVDSKMWCAVTPKA